MSLNNLAVTGVNSMMTSAIGMAMNQLQSLIANAGRDNHCKFHYANAGGSLLQVLVKGIAGGAVNELKSEACNAFNSLFDKKGKYSHRASWVQGEDFSIADQVEEHNKYGRFKVNDGKEVILALDDWGCVCTDGLMLGFQLGSEQKKINITQIFPDYKNAVDKQTVEGSKQGTIIAGNTKTENKEETIESDHLVWYDTTALININSDKNIITTRVQGRDYSRKELISNGDIKFQVSGQITSRIPDVYPTQEVKKFLNMMQHKGIIKINNQLLDQFGITHIVITDFSLSSKEGYKAVQQYTFSAIGLQPETELVINTEDTITITAQQVVKTEDEDSAWMKMLKNQLEGLKSMAKDVVSQGAALGTGYLENML